MSLTLQPVRVATGSDDTESHLVFDDGYLVAVLVQLSEQHDEAGRWFLEAGFGPVGCFARPPASFADLDEAQAWIAAQRAGAAAKSPAGPAP